jgi:uncharacterized protein (DUF2267 family)
MKVNVIKKLAEELDLETIQKLTQQLEEGESLTHEVEGDDEGEQLTHLLGAAWIREQMQQNGTDLKTELRNFTSRVRNSIS